MVLCSVWPEQIWKACLCQVGSSAFEHSSYFSFYDSLVLANIGMRSVVTEPLTLHRIFQLGNIVRIDNPHFVSYLQEMLEVIMTLVGNG